MHRAYIIRQIQYSFKAFTVVSIPKTWDLPSRCCCPKTHCEANWCQASPAYPVDVDAVTEETRN